MIALQIKDIKDFMSKLLNSDIFDFFLLEEARIHTFNSFTIDGHINQSFFSKEELEDVDIVPYDYSLWETIKPVIFQLIKGKKVPSLLKIILLLPPQWAKEVLEEAGAGSFLSCLKSFVLTIKYDSQGLVLTTGTSFSTFVMDKTPDSLWDQTLKVFLNSHDIDYQEL